MAAAAGLGLVAAMQATAHDVHVEGDQCGYNSRYAVQVAPGGIDFSNPQAHPAHVFMHDGQLRVDGHPLAVSAADAARLRDYETGMRGVLPEMAGIAQEAVGVAFDALATVAATLGGSQHHRDALVRELNDARRTALVGLDAHVNAQHWDEQGFEDAIEQPVTEAANDLASALTRHVLWAVLTGRGADVEARADAIDASVDKAMDQRSKQLEARAKLLCPRLAALQQLQRQFDFRLADGSALQLITTNKESEPKASAVAAR
jgi:hypothetical protein